MNNSRHNYEYDIELGSKTAPANVVRIVGTNKEVLEVGCGPGSITKLLAVQGKCKVTGLELDPEAIKKVTPYCVEVMQADLNTSDWPTLITNEKKFDVVVAADVLEHLYDPLTNLKKMSSFINDSGYMVISLPHVGHAAVMSCLFNGDFQYRDWGLLDRTHIRFFCLKNIQDLFAQAGLKIIEAAYVTKPAEETEFASSWAKLPNEVKSAFNRAPHAHVYQVVIKAVPINFHGQPVDLVSSIPNRSNNGSLALFKRIVGARMNASSKQKLRSLLKLVNIKI